MKMDRVLVRYGDIGTKSQPVRGNMLDNLRQRVQDRLEYEGIDFDKVKYKRGRIIALTSEANEAAKAVSELPGVKSCSPAKVTDPTLKSIKETCENLEVGESFGVRANRSGDHDFNSKDIQIEIGSLIESRTGAIVDLDNPDTLVEVDLREDEGFV